MLISFNWLKDYVGIKESATVLAKRLTMAGIEISSVNKVNEDFIYDAEITPNRADLLSVIGIAREVASLTDAKFISPLTEKSDLKNKGSNIDVKIKNPSLCLRYNATLIKDVEVKVSSEKITRRLNVLGLRPVNNIVDITNYCLLESGQPLHAFDYDKIKGKKIIVRFAKKNEVIVAIDGKEHKLDEDILVIADEEKPIAIAGIMGGLDTEIGLETKNILLECAHFDPIVIRKASRKLGLSSDSSYRFERGICLKEIPNVSERAAHLIEESANAHITNNIDLFHAKLKDSYATLRMEELERILGLNIPLEEIKNILISLGFKVISAKGNSLKVKVPSFRQDVTREIDLIEEIARIYGYDRIPSTLAKVSAKEIQNYRSSHKVTESFKYKAKQTTRTILTSMGLNEVINYSLINEKELDKFDYKKEEVIKLKDTLSIEQEILRPTLIPGLLSVLSWNLNRRIENIMVFELGKIFFKEGSEVCERERLGIGLCGDRFLSNWQIKRKTLDFFNLKGIIEKLLTSLGISDYNFIELNNNLFINGHCAKVTVGNEDLLILGKVKKGILNLFDIAEDVYLAEVYFEKILPRIKLERKIEPVGKFPAIERDMAVIVKDNLASRSIVEEIKRKSKGLIKEIILFDVYSGKQIPPGYKSLAYSIKYQSAKRTLTDEEVDEIQIEIQRALVENLKAQMR